MNEHQQPAGWYPDQHGIVRWWDGAQWTQHTAPQGAPPTATATATDDRVRHSRNGLGIAALIVGIIGCLFGLVPLMFFVAGPLGVTGLILGLAGRGRVKRREANNGKTAWAGIVVSLGALVLSVVGVAITFDAFSDLGDDLDAVSEQPAPAVEDDDGGEVADAAPAPDTVSGEDGDASAGSRENPHRAGSTADLGDWQVSVGATVADGTAAVAEADEFNPAPRDGNEYVVAPVTVTFSGDGTGTAWLDLSVEFVSAAGNTYDGFCGLMSDDLMNHGEQFSGASVEGSACAEAPADQIDGGVWRVTESFTLDQSTAFFAMD